MLARRFKDDLKVLWHPLVVIIAPLILLPIPILIGTQEAKAGYGVLLMSIFWVTEAIPLPATALMPMFLFPMLGVLGAKQIAPNYLKDANMLMMGGLLVAVAVEKSNLHKRVALRVLSIVGSKPKWLLLGFMIPTAFLSMWISNTATTAMMLPISQVVLEQFDHGRAHARKSMLSQDAKRLANKKDSGNRKNNLDPEKGGLMMSEVVDQNGRSLIVPEDRSELETSSIVEYNLNDFEKTNDNNREQEMEQFVTYNPHPDYEAHHNAIARDDKRHADFCKALSLSISYGANIGGTASLTGTGPNLILSGIAYEYYHKYGMESPISYTSWMAFGVPGAVICLFLAWLWLQVHFIGFRRSFLEDKDDNPKVTEAVGEMFRVEYAKLGPLSFAEGSNLFAFFVLVMLWLFRDPKFIDGWGTIFEKGFMTDASSVMFISFFLFVWPSECPKLKIFSSDPNTESKWGPALLDWKSVHAKMSWGVLLLLGGGFALSEVCKTSGLSESIGSSLLIMRDLPAPLIVLIVVMCVAGMTELMSNTATSSLLLPILADLAIRLNMNPLYLMLPACIACSFAFMLPVATPPNAIIYSSGHLKVIDMVRSGIIMHVLSITVVVTGIHTWGMWYFQLHTNPFSAFADVVANTTDVMSSI